MMLSVLRSLSLRLSAIAQFLVVLGLISSATLVQAQSAQEYHVFLLAGQSNIVGPWKNDGGKPFPRGTLQLNQKNVLEDIGGTYSLDHVDPTAVSNSMGFDVQFAVAYKAAYPNVRVVFVPYGAYGSAFANKPWIPADNPRRSNQWGARKPLSDQLINKANALLAARPDFKLKGILWHIGESDAEPYKDKRAVGKFQKSLDAQIRYFRDKIKGASDKLPFVMGQLSGPWVAGDDTKDPVKVANRQKVDAIITDTPNRVDYTAVVSSKGVPAQPDDILHFSAAGYRILGDRYFAALKKAQANAK